jgi:RNA processing factor Prp31
VYVDEADALKVIALRTTFNQESLRKKDELFQEAASLAGSILAAMGQSQDDDLNPDHTAKICEAMHRITQVTKGKEPLRQYLHRIIETHNARQLRNLTEPLAEAEELLRIKKESPEDLELSEGHVDIDTKVHSLAGRLMSTMTRPDVRIADMDMDNAKRIAQIISELSGIPRKGEQLAVYLARVVQHYKTGNIRRRARLLMEYGSPSGGTEQFL